MFYAAELGSDCSEPLSARACDRLDRASCDDATTRCECNDGFVEDEDGDCVCDVGMTLNEDTCETGECTYTHILIYIAFSLQEADVYVLLEKP